MLAGWFMGSVDVGWSSPTGCSVVLKACGRPGVWQRIIGNVRAFEIVESADRLSRTLVTAIRWIAGVILMLIACWPSLPSPCRCFGFSCCLTWRRLSIRGRSREGILRRPRMSDKNQGIQKERE